MSSYYEEYRSEYGAYETTEWANGIQYSFVTRKDDGWIGIFQRDSLGGYAAMTEAADYEHAKSYIAMIEPVTVPMSPLVPREVTL